MRKLNKLAFTNIVPMVLAIIITFAILFVGIYVNGSINEQLEDQYGTPAQNSIQANNLQTMNNTSANFDSVIDIVQIVIIITCLAAAIGAIFLFTRFR